MTVCNMSIEGGARCGYVNPDQTTYDYLRGRDFAPSGAAWDRAVAWWDSMRSDPDAHYDDVVRLRGEDIEPIVTWGITPGQSTPVGAPLPDPRRRSRPASARWSTRRTATWARARASRSRGTKIDVAFIGSCTNGRLSDFEEVVRHLRGRRLPRRAAREGAGRARLAAGARSEIVRRGWDQVFRDAGFEFREAGCSMCLAMNPDKLEGDAALRVVVEPQLQGPPGLAHRPHAADVAGHGGGRGDRRRGHRRPRPVRHHRSGRSMTMDDAKRTAINGPAIAVRGHDIDTDRIIPARFLKCVVFDGLGAARVRGRPRADARARPACIPFDDPRFAAPASCWSTATSAAARRASTRRRRSCAGGAASRRSSASRSPRSSPATAWRSASRA